jgi:hypothetical protein
VSSHVPIKLQCTGVYIPPKHVHILGYVVLATEAAAMPLPLKVSQSMLCERIVTGHPLEVDGSRSIRGAS